MYSYNPAASWGNIPPNNVPPGHDPRQAFTNVQPYSLSGGFINPSQPHIPPSLTPGGRPNPPLAHRHHFSFQNPPENERPASPYHHPFGSPQGPTMYPSYVQQHIQQRIQLAPPVPPPPVPPPPAEPSYRPKSTISPPPPRVLHKRPPASHSPPNIPPQIPPKVLLYPRVVPYSSSSLPPPIPPHPHSIPPHPHAIPPRPHSIPPHPHSIPPHPHSIPPHPHSIPPHPHSIPPHPHSIPIHPPPPQFSVGPGPSIPDALNQPLQLSNAEKRWIPNPVDRPPTQFSNTEKQWIPDAVDRPPPHSNVEKQWIPDADRPPPQLSNAEKQWILNATDQPSPQFLDEKELELESADVEDLAMALALSASAANQQDILKREEEEFARALEASLLWGSEDQNAVAGPSKPRSSAVTSQPGPSTYPSEPSESEVSESRSRSPCKTNERHINARFVSPKSRGIQISDDEAYARRLMLEDEQEEVVQDKALEALRDKEVVHPQPEPPSYADTITNPIYASSAKTNQSSPPLPTTSPLPDSVPLPIAHSAPSVLQRAATPISMPEAPPLQRNVSSASTSSSIVSLQEQSRATFAIGAGSPASASDDGSHLQVVTPASNIDRRPSLTSQSLSSVEETSEAASSSETSASHSTTNQYVDTDILQGVSMGYTNPTISNSMAVLSGGVPNVIELGFGQCRPFYLQAPTWRHLLKLMARMSTTRIEPSVEAMSLSKIEFKLRTVIQLVKVYNSSEWRTIIWLTIDHPVPAAVPGALKYTNGDVNVLPWSYTLSNPPALLRDSGGNTTMSKTYTIPSTSLTPYPSLPINCPNMAMYLQAALEESRRAMNDSTSGTRKLAKMIDQIYPNEHADDGGDGPEKTTVGGLFKRVMGRGNNKARRVNEDTYELVTPFVADEWG